MEINFADSLVVALFGILVVFLVLGIIIVYLMLQSKIFESLENKAKEKKKQEQKPMVSAAPQVIEQNDDEIVAVISACIYTMLQEDDTVDSDAEFVIRKIEKLKWSK